MSFFFIRNPYTAIVIAIVITICGAIAIFMLPVAQYPNITPPQVSITTTYPGADAKTLLQTVVEPVEQQVNGVRNMIYMLSSASNSGSVNIVVTFDIGTNGEDNTRNVQSRVNWALPQLPEAVQREGVIVREQSGNILLAIALYSPDRTYDALFLSNYASVNLVNELSRIHGVSQVRTFGSSDYAMRVKLRNEKLAALKLTVNDVVSAIREQNTEVSSGAVGAAPIPKDLYFHYTVQAKGRLTSTEEFGNIIVRSLPDGAQVKLKEIADLELGAETYDLRGNLNNMPAVMLVVYQLSDANGLAISDACRATMEKMSKFFPSGLEYGIKYDSTSFIRVSIHDVVRTLILAIIIVALTVYLFLQDWRMALVPTLAIPVSIIGTFAVLKLLGFSINLVTLFALILAIGIVVDDAIIVIENVSRLMKDEHLAPRDAAEKSMRQITGAIVATTSVLLAMFLPICFLSGITGELYRQFGVTISVAVLLSAVNALTLSPALSAVFLKPDERTENFFLFRWFNTAFGKAAAGYERFLERVVRRISLPLLLYFLIALAGGALYFFLPSGFIPQEDQGVIFGNIQLPSNTSLSRTEKITEETTAILKKVPGIKDVITISGFNILNMNPAPNNAFLIATLEPWAQRLKHGLSADKITMLSEYELQNLPEAFFMLFQPPPIPGIGMAGGFNFVLQEKTGTNAPLLKQYLDEMIGAAYFTPELRNVFSFWNAETSFIYLNIDREKAMKSGVDPASLDNMLASSLGFVYINDFNRFGQVYKVEIQSVEELRNTQDKINRLYIANNGGAMVPLASLVKLESRVAPESLSRYNMHLAAQIQGAPAPGVSSGTAMKLMENLAAKALPDTLSYSWTDMSYQEARAGNQNIVIFTLAVVFIFLFLAALYGSWMLPLSVIAAIPLVFPGAVLFLRSAGLDNNLYTHVGVILLFAMVCKTSILIVDFAKKQHDSGSDAATAAREAAHLRFRAILMTALAFILGTLPLAFADGPGSGSQRSIGCAIVGGMSFAVVCLIFLVPLFYMVCEKLKQGRSAKN